MEIRPRHSGFRTDYCSTDLSLPTTDDSKPAKRSSPAWRRLKREVGCTLRTLVDILTGRASKFTYLIAPVLFAMSWVLIMIITGSRSVSFHDRMVQSKREYEAYHMKLESQHKIIQIELPPEGTFHVVVAMPFLDVNPLAGEMYIKMLEWMLIYSTIPLTFHVLTNADSVDLVHKVMAKINGSHHGDFDYHVVQLTSIIDQCTHTICPQVLKVAKSDFCEVLMGRMTPLLFPWLFPDLDHAIYVDRNIVFQGNIAEISHELSVLRASETAALAMAPEQTLKYRRAFSGWQTRNPSTKLGRPPPEGRPGYNADLILMDLAKLRRSTKYKSYFSETKLSSLIKMYQYLSSDGSPDMGDVLNIIAADSGSELVHSLSCRWNRNTSKANYDSEFNVCPDQGPVLAWNGQPDPIDIVRRG